MKNIILAFLISIPFVGMGQNNNDSLVSINRNGYSIQSPSNWRIDTSNKVALIDLFIFSPKDAPDDTFSENVNVVVQDLGADSFRLDQYVALNEAQIKKMASNLLFIENKRIRQGEKEFHKFIFTSFIAATVVTTEQYYFVFKGKAFVLTLSTEEKKYELYKPIGEKILDSFEISE